LVQVVYAEVDGDKVLAAASSRELPRYGFKTGLKNYAAAYSTGLLAARRLLKTIGLDEVYSGVEEPKGEVIKTKGDNGRTYFVETLDEDKKPFRALLDVGIKNTTTGSKVFAAMKGASDGGLDIPHSHKRFPGYSRDTKTYDAAMHKGRIFAEHIADYMREMEEDDEENYKKHFASYVTHDLEADDLEEEIEKVHAAIREDPAREAAVKFDGINKKYKKGIKKTAVQRKADAATKKAALRAAAGVGGDAADAMDEEEE
jgi:large subunit ribosomal protein L5e